MNSVSKNVLDCDAPVPLWRVLRRGFGKAVIATTFLTTSFASAVELTNSTALPLSPSLPSAAPSLLRVLGALAIVLGLFLGGAWLFRNGRHLRFRQGHTPRLNILESRGFGGKHALYVVGYDQQRMLIAASPTGISLLSQLPPASETSAAPAAAPQPLSFAETLARVLNNSLGKSPSRQSGGPP